jgi:broad specificity phosphatase PhoE
LNESRILLLRHAETATPDRFHGAESDVGLSEWGLSQADRVAESLRLKGLSIQAVYSSGMLRARQTASPIANAFEVEPRLLPGLHERKIGPLSGQSREAGWEIYHESKRRWVEGDLDATHSGGESYREVQQRVTPIFQDLGQRHRGETVVVVSHGIVIRVLLTSLLAEFGPADFDRIAIDFASLNDLRYGHAGWRVTQLNEVVAPSAARPVA